MYHTYFFQKRLAYALNNRLKGLKLLECFSQQRDELVLVFGSPSDEFIIRANLESEVGILSFPDQFARARKNSVDIFEEIFGENVQEVSPYPFERSFNIRLTSHDLIFKMHGSRCNVLLAKGDGVVKVFRNKLARDRELVPSELGRAAPENNESLYRLLGSYANRHLSDGRTAISLEQLETNQISLVLDDDERPQISLLDETHPEGVTENALEASNWLAEQFYSGFQLGKEKQQVIQLIDTQVKRGNSYLKKTTGKLNEVVNQRNPEEFANLIMANLHQIPAGAKQAELDDFYGSGQVRIKLNPKLSPQKNAEQYYRRGKNKQLEVDKLKENIQAKKEQLNQWATRRAEVEQIQDLKSLRKYRKQHFSTLEEKEVVLPYHLFGFEGFEILVGKNARANDELTLKMAHKDDLWLHAKDVPGSHVVIRQRPGQNFPENVIEKAAALAAWYSKRKTDSLCPVIYTPKKFVRKVKGSPPGQVVVEKEEVVMIEPSNEI